MSKKYCLTATPEIKYLAKVVDMDLPTTIAKVGTWMEENNTNLYPTPELLGKYVSNLAESINSLYSQRSIDKAYSPKMRKDRATLLATLFSDEINTIQEEYPEKTRVLIIDEYTPIGIYQRVRDLFEEVSQDNTITEYEKNEYNKLLSHFNALILESASDLLLLEGIDISGFLSIEANLNEVNVSGESIIDEYNEEFIKEELILDGWLINYRHIAPSESLSAATRAAIQRIERIGLNGEVDTDDLGFKRYLDPAYVHASLIDKLRFMTEANDLMPMLNLLATTKPWVNGIIELLKSNESLLSQFYLDFRKDFIPYSIQRRTLNSDGTYSYKTININRPEGINFLLNEWRDNYESSNILTELSIYNKNGTLNKDNIINNLKQVQLLQANINKAEDKKLWILDNLLSINNLSKSLGIDVDIDTLGEALNNSILEYLSSLLTIFFLLNRNKNNTVDLANEYKGPYTRLAEIIAKVTDNAIESSVNENGKSYYSHTVPSYIGKIMKLLKSNSTKFDDFINNDFKQFLWFYKDNKFRNEWLREIVEGDRNIFDHKVLLNFNKINYSSMDSLDYTIAIINEFFSDPKGNTAWYHIPILSDSPSGEFLRFKRYTNNNVPLKADGTRLDYKEFITNKLVEVALLEYDRIKIVRARLEGIKNGSIQAISNFDSRGLEFVFLPVLNLHLNTIDELINSNDPSSSDTLYTLIRDTIRLSVEDKFNTAINNWSDIDLFQMEGNNLKYLSIAKNKDNARTLLENYFWNSYFAESLILLLITTDLAFYKDIEDFLKRNKQIHSPSLRLNTNSKYGRKVEKTLYLKDQDDFISNSITQVQNILDKRVSDGLMSKIDRDNIVNKFKEINVADALAYRSLSSYRAIMDMSGLWTPQMDEAFERFKNGSWDMRDFDIIWLPKKPFMFTLIAQDSKTLINGEPVMNKVPVLNKNSEFLLLMTGLIKTNPKLSALSEFMEENDIDVIQFESTVKVGKQGLVDINNLNNKSLIKSHLSSHLNDPEFIHELSYEDYGILQAVPEHSIDATLLFGTLIRKLITADINNNTLLTVNDKTYNKLEWLKLYNSIITENLIDSFREVNLLFSSPQEIQRVLHEEIRNNSRYGNDMLHACTLNSKGLFNIPLFDPVQSQRILSLLNSVIKNTITKQKIKGGSLVLLSNYGFTDELNIIWNYNSEGKATSIKHFEAYMPWHTRLYFEELIDNNGILDINKVPDNLRELVGYRIPTEDKYSMIPIYIKGFLPQLSGGAIMLPAEITTLSGSDFDIDKLYVMLPEFLVRNKIDWNKAWRDFKNLYNFIDKEVSNSIGKWFANTFKNADIFSLELSDEDIKDLAKQDFRDFIRANIGDYIEGREIVKILYDTNKLPKDNSLKARNNMLIDMIKGVLTNPDTTPKMINPGGFDVLKRAARIITILQNADSKTLRDFAKGKDIVTALNNLSLKLLNGLANKYKIPLDMLDPTTLVKLHLLNMTAAKLIGIFANHNANHALILHTNVTLSADGSFILNNKTLTSLHDVINSEGTYISRNNAGYLAASVDAVKDPVLNFMNLNTFTADVAMLLSRLGYSPLEVGLLLSQPIVIKMTLAFNRDSKNGLDKETIIDNVLLLYKDDKSVGISEYPKEETFNLNMLTNGIMLSKEIDEAPSNDKSIYYDNLVKLGYLFKRIQSSALSLADLTAATRADTGGGGAGPTIADTELKLLKVRDYILEVAQNPKSKIKNGMVILDYLSWLNEEEMREKLLSSPLPFMLAFYSLGLKETERLMKPYFPHFNVGFRGVIDRMRDRTKSGRINARTMNSIYNDLMTYIMTDTVLFSGEDFRTTRDYFINKFPAEFNLKIANNKDLQELSFIKGLKVLNQTVPSIVFRNVGKLTNIQREEISRDWANMLSMGEESRLLAIDLFKYSFYRSGFAFGSNSFIHLAPTAIRIANPEYNNALYNLINSTDEYFDFDMLYLLNHPENRKLVPAISASETSGKFINDKGEFLDEVNVTLGDRIIPADKNFYYRKNMLEGIVWFPLISITNNGKELLYININNSNSATFYKIDRLGVLNGYLEYENGTHYSEIETVVKPTKNVLLGEVDYDSDTSPINYSDNNSLNEREYIAALEAFQQIYNTEMILEKNPLDTFETNQDFRDAEGNPLC